MKVELVANMAANGQLILASNGNAYEAPEEISGMGFMKAAECGNVVMGLTTYELFGDAAKSIPGIKEIVVLNPEKVDDTVYTAKNAADAVSYLEGKGFEKACVVGGTMTFNSFFEEECVDELFFNLFPIIINGGPLEAAPGQVLGGFKLDYAKACGDVVCTHFVR